MKRKIMFVMALAASMSMFLTGCEIDTGAGNKPSIVNEQGNADLSKDLTKDSTANDVKTEDDTNKDVTIDDDNNDGVDTNDKTGTNVVDNKIPETPESVKEAFEDFLYNDGVVFCDIGGFEGKDYTFEQMLEAKTNILREEWYSDDMIPTEQYYDYIDCGLDGIEELVVEVEYCIDPDYDTDLLDEFFIFKVYDGKVTLIDMEEGYSRSCVSISKAGGIENSGSGGANLACYDFSFINADGEKIFDYSLNMYLDLAEAIVPYYEIPAIIRPDDYPIENYNEDANRNGVECDKYNFVKYDYETFQDDNDAYLSSNMYVFVDSRGNDAKIDERYELFYDEHGIEYHTTDEMMKILDDHEQAIGLTEDVKGIGEYIDLKELLN